jgi:hypothetical protein
MVVFYLSELREILNGFLDFFQAVANGVGLVHDLEDRVSESTFVQEVVHGHACGAELSQLYSSARSIVVCCPVAVERGGCARADVFLRSG